MRHSLLSEALGGLASPSLALASASSPNIDSPAMPLRFNSDTAQVIADCTFDPDAIPRLNNRPCLAAILDGLRDPVLLVDVDGKVLFRNSAADRLLATAPDACSRPVARLPASWPWDALSRVLRLAQNGLQPLEHELLDPDSGKCWLAYIRELASLHGTQPRFLIHLRDITETNRLRHSLQAGEALARTGTVMAGAAHQAKNALFGLTATLEAFQLQHRETLGDDPYLRNLQDGIARLQLIVRDLFDFGRTPLQQRALISPADVIREAFQGCRQLAVDRFVRVKLDLSDQVQMYGDAASLVRAFENIIDNAIQHSPESGDVWVKQCLAAGKPGVLQCTVRDSGPGFPAREMEHLFTPFFTRRKGGTGLGLTIARKVIEDHGGSIQLENAASGGGLVTILLPLDRRARGVVPPARLAESR